MFQNPTVVGTLGFVGSCGGSFYGFELETGKVVWQHDTSLEGLRSTFHADGVTVGDLVITAADGSPDSHVYAFEPTTGAVRWQRAAPPRGVSSALVTDGETVFVVAASGEVLALGGRDGSLLWSARLPAGLTPRRGRPLLAGQRLVVVEDDGTVLAFDPAKGTLLWRQDLGERLSPAAQASGDQLLVPAATGELLTLDAATGSVVARRTVTDGPLVGGLPLAASCLVVTGAPRSVTCADPKTGERHWRFETVAELTTFTPLVDGTKVWVGDETGRLTALSLVDGRVAESFFVPGIPRGLTRARGWLVVGTRNGAILGYRLDGIAPAPLSSPPP